MKNEWSSTFIKKNQNNYVNQSWKTWFKRCSWNKTMSINCYQELAKDRKLTTIKYPTKDDNSDWEYVITGINFWFGYEKFDLIHGLSIIFA